MIRNQVWNSYINIFLYKFLYGGFKMKIAIYGAGAMGTVLGAYLAKSGKNVELIDNFKEHVDALNEKGATIVGKDNFNIKVKASTPDQMSGEYDYVFLFTKQTANEIVLPHLKRFLKTDSVVCTLQNGVPEYSVEKIIGGNRTVGGTVLWGATFVEPGVSEVTQDINVDYPLFDIGEISGEITSRIEKVAKILEGMCQVEIVTNLMEARWSKVLLNSSMSGLSAISGATFGDILENDKARSCLSLIASEIVKVAEQINQELAPTHGVDTIEYGIISTPNEFKRSQKHFIDFYDDKRTAKASMLQDLEKNRKTEVEMINGFVVEAGEKCGVTTPRNKKIVEIVNRIEKGRQSCSMNNIEELI